MKKLLFIFAITASALASCETLVNDVDQSRLPQTSRQLVIHGYFSPQDTLLQVSVGISSPVTGANVGRNFGGTVFSLPGAEVTLSNQGRSIQLLFNSKVNHYAVKASEMPILAGQTYNLKVTLNGQTVESSCMIPRAVAISEVREDSVVAQGFFSSNPNVVPPKDRTYRLFWQDAAGEANFYRVSGYFYQIQRFQTGMNQFREQPSLANIRFNDGRSNSSFITDERQDGTLMASGVGRLNSFWFRSDPTIVANTRRAELSLISCEKIYYNYHRLIESFDGDNPFSEPTLIPSNIKGGLGCFAGYNRTNFTVKMR